MTFRDSLRQTVDAIRGGVPGNLGLRTVQVAIVVRSWSGGRVGLGTPTVTSTAVLNAGHNPKVTELNSKDVVASGGLYSSGDLRVGPFTPAHPGGGNAKSAYEPAPGPDVAETWVVLTYDAVDGGDVVWCISVSQDDDTRNFRRTMVVRRTGEQPDITL